MKLINLFSEDIKATQRSTRATKNAFNDLARELGCKARIGGNARKIELQKFTGNITPDGYELVVGVNSVEFGKLINVGW